MCDSVGSGFCDINAVASVMFHGGPGVPSVVAVWVPGFVFVKFDADNDLCSRRGEGSYIEIKISVDLGICRELGIEP